MMVLIYDIPCLCCQNSSEMPPHQENEIHESNHGATEEGLDVFFEISRYSTIVLTIEVFQEHL